jgi:predicted naringenin-chalcone synthase
MTAQLLGVGTATPAHSIEQSAAAELASARCCATAAQLRLLPVLYRRTRVERRGSVLLHNGTAVQGGAQHQEFFPVAIDASDRGPSTAARLAQYAKEAAPLAADAARSALDDASVSAEEIDHLVTVTCTGFGAPGIELALIQSLGLKPTVARTQIGFMGCHGALNGLRAANSFCRAEPGATALVCAVELCSLHFHYGWEPGRIVANALFADGAAAAVLRSTHETSNKCAWQLAANGSCIFPDSADAMTWTIADHGFEMTLSARVPELIGVHLKPWLQSWLSQSRISIEDVRSWAIHPGGPRIVETVVESLGLPASASAASQYVLASHGNMSSPTILFILNRLRRSGAALPCVALGFGPGLAVEAALFVDRVNG